MGTSNFNFKRASENTSASKKVKGKGGALSLITSGILLAASRKKSFDVIGGRVTSKNF